MADQIVMAFGSFADERVAAGEDESYFLAFTSLGTSHVSGKINQLKNKHDGFPDEEDRRSLV